MKRKMLVGIIGGAILGSIGTWVWVRCRYGLIRRKKAKTRNRNSKKWEFPED